MNEIIQHGFDKLKLYPPHPIGGRGVRLHFYPTTNAGNPQPKSLSSNFRFCEQGSRCKVLKL